ncbi:CapA family protein [Aquabacterium sp.]|uniref:CapA family protein n=1 Tax=Aquabacterium sp. TaxID=1872578 RepID=UPI0025BDAA73|nr:CapA family protein [Aquabacterium sp.]
MLPVRLPPSLSAASKPQPAGWRGRAVRTGLHAARRPWLALGVCLGLIGPAWGAEAPTAEPPELLCALRLAGQTALLRAPFQPDPYAGQTVDFPDRFRVKTVAWGEGGEGWQATVTLIDTETEDGPTVLQQVSWSQPLAMAGARLQAGERWRPALSGWQRVYSPHLGRELDWGCAVVGAGQTPPGAAEADATIEAVPPALRPAPRPVAQAAGVAPAGPTVRIAWLGDVMLADGPGRVIRQGRDPFAHVASRLAEADLRIANLECVIARGGKALAKPWTFRAHPRALPVLQRHVDLVSLANNHSGDYGVAAFAEMLDRLDRAGLAYVGGGHNLREAHRVRIVERKGLKIALLAANEMFPRRFEAGDTTPGIAWAEDAQLLHDVRTARAQADIVIPYLHWGTEGDEQAHERQRALARRLIEAGADAVVGTHPHLVQDTEVYQGKPIAYSLGNAVFDGFSSPLNNTGALLWLEVNRQGVTAWHMETLKIDPLGVPRPVTAAAVAR